MYELTSHCQNKEEGEEVEVGGDGVRVGDGHDGRQPLGHGVVTHRVDVGAETPGHAR